MKFHSKFNQCKMFFTDEGKWHKGILPSSRGKDSELHRTTHSESIISSGHCSAYSREQQTNCGVPYSAISLLVHFTQPQKLRYRSHSESTSRTTPPSKGISQLFSKQNREYSCLKVFLVTFLWQFTQRFPQTVIHFPFSLWSCKP